MKILITGGSGFIGSQLVENLLSQGNDFINIDKVVPKIESHVSFWFNCNILDLDRLLTIFTDYQPTHVLHLAAKADTVGKTLLDYQDNIQGTANVLRAISNTASISRIIITSSQHVRKPGSETSISDQDFTPHGLYGESKVITEKLTRQANLDCVWTIIRPTTVWGPLHPFLPYGLWKYMKKGIYLHPKDDPVIRGYGYVKNVVWQMENLLEVPEELIHGKIFYVGDEVMKQSVWINAFSNAISGHNVHRVPRNMIRAMAYAGDIIKHAKLPFPMDSDRFFNLTTSNPVPMSPIFELLGKSPYTLEDGIFETVNWLNSKVFHSRKRVYFE